MTYKDQTFCNDWCDNKQCFRNYQHIVEAQKENGFLNVNPWMPVSFFVAVPMDCKERIPKNSS
jgi:hypothetical protein